MSSDTRKKKHLHALLRIKKEHPKQEEATQAKQSTRALFWGNRVGKTEWGAHEIARYCFSVHPSRNIDLPIEIWCGCPSFDVQLETTQKKLAPLISHRIADITWAKKNVWGRVLLDNGTILTFKSYEQGASKWQGTGKRLIWFDEEPPRDIYEEASVRMEAGIPLDTILTMTPVNGMTWVYDEIYLNTDNPNIFVSTADWDDNPWLTDEQKALVARNLTEAALKVRREGKFMRRVGLVCNWWDRGVHVMEDMKVDPTWRVFRIVDFGWSSSKTCVLWIGVDSEDNTYIFDGIYQNQLPDEQLADEILLREAKMGGIIRGIADNQPERIEALSRKGVYCEPVEKKTSGENWDELRTEAMAVLGKVDPETDKSKLFVSPSLTIFDEELQREVNWFVREIESLRWKEKKAEVGVTEVPKWDKDKRPKGANHHYDAMDCFSYYAVMVSKPNITAPAPDPNVFQQPLSYSDPNDDGNRQILENDSW